MVKRLTFLIAALGILALLTGCGGGGGGGGSRVTVTAIADWTNFGSPISGSSMKWSVFTTNESLVQSIAINRTSTGEQSATISNLPKGTYHLRVELFSNPDLGGTLVGVLDELIQVNGNGSYAAAVGTAPASVKVTPATATFKAGQGKQFYAACYNSASRATFAAPGSITWQTQGGVATVNETGFVQGSSAGSGQVIATHTPTSLQGGATLTIQSSNVTTSKWTVLVFLNGANDLYQFSDLNVNQMERVADNPDVRFVVQWKQSTNLFPGASFNGTRRYLVKPDNTSDIASELVQNMGTNVDMGKKETLHDFIGWAKTFYPAQRYCLIVWNHGNGWHRGLGDQFPTRAVSYDDETQNAIQTWELAQALGSNTFDIIAWDASLMQMLEVAHEIQDHADYVVGSEESPPGEGYPYHLVFDAFRDNPDASTLALSKGFVDGPLEYYQNSALAKITQSVIDTNELPNLATQVNTLATQLIANVGTPGFSALIQSVRANAKSYSPTSARFYRDLWDVCDRIQADAGIPLALRNACVATKTAVESAVKWEGHKSSSNGSHGISIDFSTGTKFDDYDVDYAKLRFANDTQWNEWLTVAP